MAIACVYCGGSHGSAGEVKDCWQRNGSQQVPASDTPTDPFGSADFGPGPINDPSLRSTTRPTVRSNQQYRPTSDTTLFTTTAPVQAWMEPGPDELARGLVITAGATIAAPWRDAERIVIDQSVIADPEPAVAMLMQHASAGHRIVIELATPFALAPRSTEPDPR